MCFFMLRNVYRAGYGGALDFFYPETATHRPIPFFLCCVQAGFPSPAEDYLEAQLDLHQLLIKNPSSTFFVRVIGNSMRGAEIDEGDILVVDRKIKPCDGMIAVCCVNGSYTVKRLNLRKDGTVHLLPENPSMPVIQLQDLEELRVFGVVTTIIKRLL